MRAVYLLELYARTRNFRSDAEPIEQTRQGIPGSIGSAGFERCGPASGLRFQAQNQGSACLGVTFLLEKNQNRGCIFDGAPEAKPAIERHVAHHARGKIAEVEGNESKATALQKQVGGTESVFDIPAAHPQQFFQVNTSRLGRVGIKGIAAIDEGAGFGMSSSGA